MLPRIVLIITMMLSFCSLAGAETYQWVDENGVVTFRDTPPPASKKRKKVKVYNEGDFTPAPPVQAKPATRGETVSATPAPQPASPQKERFTGTVELYVTDWCGYCKKARNYLESRGIPYVAYDIEKDGAARQRHRELGGRGVPLIVVGSRKMSGFSAEQLDHLLNNGKE